MRLQATTKPKLYIGTVNYDQYLIQTNIELGDIIEDDTACLWLGKLDSTINYNTKPDKSWEVEIEIPTYADNPVPEYLIELVKEYHDDGCFW